MNVRGMLLANVLLCLYPSTCKDVFVMTRRQLITALAVPLAGLFVGMVLALLLQPGTTTHRMTRSELAQSAAQPNAASQYDYYFSREELARIVPTIRPYNCVSGRQLSARDQYQCGIDSIFVSNRGGFVPLGYKYQGALRVKGTLVGIRIVRTPDWLPAT